MSAKSITTSHAGNATRSAFRKRHVHSPDVFPDLQFTRVDTTLFQQTFVLTSLPPLLYTNQGLSENKEPPSNPLVNHHFPYSIAIIGEHFLDIRNFQTKPSVWPIDVNCIFHSKLSVLGVDHHVWKLPMVYPVQRSHASNVSSCSSWVQPTFPRVPMPPWRGSKPPGWEAFKVKPRAPLFQWQNGG